MGTLSTIANNAVNNFILLIIDNGSYGSTGDQLTYAGKKTSLKEIAIACGCENVLECQAEETAGILKSALENDKMTIIVSKCESGNVKVPVVDLDPVIIRHRFMTKLNNKNLVNLLPYIQIPNVLATWLAAALFKSALLTESNSVFCSA